MNQVLLLGGAGFIGFHCLRFLLGNSECSITIVDDLSRGRMDAEMERLLASQRVHFIQRSLTELETLEDLPFHFDYIFHFAAIVGVSNVLANPDRVLWVNTLSTLYLLNWIAGKGAKSLKRLFFASTSEAYAQTLSQYGKPIPTPETVPLTVDAAYPRRSTYALSKIYGEQACLTYARKYGFPVTIVRPHNIYGPRMGYNHVIPELLLKASQSSEDLDVYSVNHSRSFFYIDDAVEAIMSLAVAKEAENRIVNLGNGQDQITIFELAKIVTQVVNPRLVIKPCEQHEGSPESRCPDTSLLNEITRLKPRHSLKNGIEKTWAWYRNHPKP